jgi:hypothetical protein
MGWMDGDGKNEGVRVGEARIVKMREGKSFSSFLHFVSFCVLSHLYSEREIEQKE